MNELHASHAISKVINEKETQKILEHAQLSTCRRSHSKVWRHPGKTNSQILGKNQQKALRTFVIHDTRYLVLQYGNCCCGIVTVDQCVLCAWPQIMSNQGKGGGAGEVAPARGGGIGTSGYWHVLRVTMLSHIPCWSIAVSSS